LPINFVLAGRAANKRSLGRVFIFTTQGPFEI
jgi:hypothetical protein